MIACDLGSNTFRVVEIDCFTKERVKEFERIVKTADQIHQTGVINQEAVYRVIDAINEAKAVFDFESSEVYAVTTAAMRLANNSDEVLKRIEEETGLKLTIIDAKEEARLASLAVENRLEKEQLDSSGYVLMDLGGGSTEIVIKNGLKSFDKSFDVGIVTVVQRYNGNIEELKEGLEEELEDILAFFQESYEKLSKPFTFIGTAGTPTTIASFVEGIDYLSYSYKKVNGKVLTIADIDRALEQLMEMDEETRVRWVGTGRSDLIVAGVLILKKIVEYAGFDKMTVIDDGIREGAAIAKCK